METVADLFLYVFYALNVGATVFFLHKVLWLVRYKRLQGILVQEAVARLSSSQVREIDAFGRFAVEVWEGVADAGVADTGASGTLGEYIARADERIRDVRRSLRTSRASIRGPAMEAARSAEERTAAGTALCIPLPGAGDVREVRWELALPPLLAKRRLDPQLYEVKTASRYGFWRRALVFFAGIADVVYSAQHVAVISQNTHAPAGVLLRRLSLVALLVVMIMGDLIFGIRKAISAALEDRFGAPDLGSLGDAGSFVSANFGTIAGVLLWTAALSLVYFAAALAVRWRSRVWHRRLLAMRSAEEEQLAAVHGDLEEELVTWLDGYTASLDQAVDLGARHAALLVDYHRGRLQRRVVEASPVRLAKVISAALLAELPEASSELADRATTHRRSFWHHVWPREEEMRVEVELAQVRAAWQDIEHTLRRLSRPRPDPDVIDGLFQSLVIYAGAFRELLPESTSEDLREGYRRTVEQLVAETRADLDEIDARLDEIATRLNEQLAVAGSLVKFQVEMTNHKIETGVNKLSSEVLALRERARLEAMAFEI
ncbi:MAG: hypothetical protein R3B70_40895 [Polyangiaceae bacterium]